MIQPKQNAQRSTPHNRLYPQRWLIQNAPDQHKIIWQN